MASFDVRRGPRDLRQIRSSLLSELAVQIADLTGRLTISTLCLEGRCSELISKTVIRQLEKKGRLVPRTNEDWTTPGWLAKGMLTQSQVDELVTRLGRTVTVDDIVGQFGISYVRAVAVVEGLRLGMNQPKMTAKMAQIEWIQRSRLFRFDRFKAVFNLLHAGARQVLAKHVNSGLIEKLEADVYALAETDEVERATWLIENIRTWRPREGTLGRVVSDELERHGAMKVSALKKLFGEKTVDRTLLELRKRGLIRRMGNDLVGWAKIVEWEPKPGSMEAVLMREVERHGVEKTAEKYGIDPYRVRRITRYMEVKRVWAEAKPKRKRKLPRRGWWERPGADAGPDARGGGTGASAGSERADGGADPDGHLD